MNKLLTHSAILCLIMLSSTGQNDTKSTTYDSPNIIFHFPDKLGTNVNFSIDDMEEYGMNVIYTGLTETVNTCSWSSPLGNIAIQTDTLITDIENIADYDAFVILSSPWWDGVPYRDLMNSSAFIQMVKDAFESEVTIWATCAGVRVLAKADIINGLDVTGRANFQAEYINAGANYLGPDIMPVTDHHVITSTRGMYFHQENMEAIIQELVQSERMAPLQKSNDLIEHNSVVENTNVIWAKTFGGYDSDAGKDIINTSDGGFAIAGYSWSAGNGKSDMLLIKTDENGNVEWNKTFGGAGWEYAYSLIELSSGDLVFAGYTTSEGAGKMDFYVVKTDADGNEIWSKTFGGENIDVVFDIIETSDGNLVAFGYTGSFDVDMNDFYAVKIDMDGNEIWSKTYGGEQIETGRKVIENHNGEYMFLGSTGSYGAGNRDVYLICTNTNGEDIWKKTYGTDAYNCAFDMIEVNNNGYAIVGHSDVHGTELLDVYYVRTDSAGNETLSKRFESELKFYDYGKSIIQTKQGYIAICGATKTKATRANDIYMMVINENAEIMWEQIIGKEGSEWSTAFCETSDGNFAVVGHTNSEGEGRFDAYLLKVQNPYVSINSISPNDTYLMPVIPNPANNSAYLNINVGIKDNATIEIYDNTGKRIKSYCDLTPGNNSIVWNCVDENNTKVSAGIYHVLLSSNKTMQAQKVVVCN